MSPNPQFHVDLVTVTAEILIGKLHFFSQCFLLFANPIHFLLENSQSLFSMYISTVLNLLVKFSSINRIPVFVFKFDAFIQLPCRGSYVSIYLPLLS